MATNSVPGADPRNHDKLDVGCWAEHQDGSLIFVQGFEDDRVIYSIFDPSKSPMLEYRDAMLIGDFEKSFSCTRDDIGKRHRDDKGRFVTKDVWTWHDKTKFPWDRVLEAAQDGPRFTSASSLLSAAARVADDLKLRADQLRGVGGIRSRMSLRDRLGKALSALTE